MLLVFIDVGRDRDEETILRALKWHRQFSRHGMGCLLWQTRPTAGLASVVLARWPGVTFPVVAATPEPAAAVPDRPHAVLVGVRGRAALRGPPDSIGKRLSSAVLTEVSQRRSGWGTTARIRSARSLLYSRGGLARSRQILLGREPLPEHRDEHARCLREIDERFTALLRRVRFHVDRGRWGRAAVEGGALVQGVKGWETSEDVALEALRPLGANAARHQLRLDGKISHIMEAVRSRGPRPRDVAALQRILQDAPAGTVTDRGHRLLDLLRTASERDK